VSRKSFTKALDEALTPLGFKRDGDDWIRVRGDLWDCVNKQTAMYFGTTFNLYKKELETEKLYLAIFGPTGATRLPLSGVRLNSIIGGRDQWWRSDDPDGPSDMVEALLTHGVPWFDKDRTLGEQADQLRRIKPPPHGRYYGWLLVWLAMILYRMGERDEACAVLRRPIRRTESPAHVEKVARVRAWMGCDTPSDAP
jgi:hypothetical protein